MDKTKPLKILIPNGTSPKNIGDLAMLESLMQLIKQQRPEATVVIHSTDPHLYDRAMNMKHTLYSWAVFDKTDVLSRIKRMLQLVIATMLLKFNPRKNISGELGQLLKDYQNADLIIFHGGGYLRSKSGFTQTLNLLMQLMMIVVAKTIKQKVIVAPISFGPFAYSWQEKISAATLKNLQLVMAREQYSYQLLKKHGIKNLIQSIDLGLMLSPTENAQRNHTLGLTIRKWLKLNKQKQFEQAVIKAVEKFAKQYQMKIQPILQVDAPEYGENDQAVTQRVVNELSKKGLTVEKIKKVNTVEDAYNFYGELTMLLGMRMHSNILAAVKLTPFVAISYEYKTEGISHDIGLDQNCISCGEVTTEKLYAMLEQTYKNKNALRDQIKQRLENKRATSNQVWQHFFETYAN